MLLAKDVPGPLLQEDETHESGYIHPPNLVPKQYHPAVAIEDHLSIYVYKKIEIRLTKREMAYGLGVCKIPASGITAATIARPHSFHKNEKNWLANLGRQVDIRMPLPMIEYARIWVVRQ
jgi:hypothetical protein